MRYAVKRKRWASSVRGTHGVFGVGVRQRRRGRYQIIPNVASAEPMFSMVFNHGELPITVDGASLVVPANTLFIWDVSPRVDYGRPGMRWDISWLQCLPPLFDGLPCRDELPLNRAVRFSDARVVDRFFRTIHDEFLGVVEPDDDIVGNTVVGAALQVRRQVRGGVMDGEMVPNALREVESFMREHYDQKLTLSILSRRVGMAPAYLSRRFKEFFGIGPIEWLIERRLSEAALYLKATDMPIREIAEVVGYGDIYHFSKSFRKRYGASPRAFRGSEASAS